MWKHPRACIRELATLRQSDVVSREHDGVTMADSNYERADDFERGGFPCKPIVYLGKRRAVNLIFICGYARSTTMLYDIRWIIPKLRNTGRLWNLASSFTFAAVGLFSKIIIEWLNKTTVHNKHIIRKALDHRPKNVPLITVSNHHSCFDDPGLWATFDLRHILNKRKMRWSLAAHDICFTNVWHSYFFMLGKCIPVVRGDGIYQESMNFCIEKLSSGDWVHVFPEGKVNMLKEHMRIKWGIGRLILESPVTPLVIPICHLGMDQVLPNDPPYMIRTRKKVTMNYGEPIDFSELLADLRASKASEVESRKAITDRIEEELHRLKIITEELHVKL